MNISYAAAWRLSFVSLLLLIAVRMAPPFSWAQTQFLFSYEAGFQRRALLGEFLRWIYPRGMTQQDTYMVAALLTLGAVAVLFFFVGRGLAGIANGGMLLVVFSFSLGLGTFVGNTGNLDAILLVLAIAALAMPKGNVAQVGLASLLCALGAFFHENMLPYFALLVAVDVWLRNAAQQPVRRLLLAGMPVVITGLVVALLFAFGSPPLSQAGELISGLQSRALDFEIRPSALEPVLAFPLGVAGDLDGVWQTGSYRFRLLAFGGVGLLFLAGFVWGIQRAMSHRSRFDQIVVLAAIVSPLSLLFVAFDVSRFIAIAVLNVFLALSVLARQDKEFRRRLPEVVTPLAIVTLLVLQAHVGLRDLNSRQNYEASFPGAILVQSGWFARQ